MTWTPFGFSLFCKFQIYYQIQSTIKQKLMQLMTELVRKVILSKINVSETKKAKISPFY
jgi:hypothetical protein